MCLRSQGRGRRQRRRGLVFWCGQVMAVLVVLALLTPLPPSRASHSPPVCKLNFPPSPSTTPTQSHATKHAKKIRAAAAGRHRRAANGSARPGTFAFHVQGIPTASAATPPLPLLVFLLLLLHPVSTAPRHPAKPPLRQARLASFLPSAANTTRRGQHAPSRAARHSPS